MGGMSVCGGVVVVGASFSEALSGLSLVILLRYQLDLVLVLVSINSCRAEGHSHQNTCSNGSCPGSKAGLHFHQVQCVKVI